MKITGIPDSVQQNERNPLDGKDLPQHGLDTFAAQVDGIATQQYIDVDEVPCPLVARP